MVSESVRKVPRLVITVVKDSGRLGSNRYHVRETGRLYQRLHITAISAFLSEYSPES